MSAVIESATGTPSDPQPPTGDGRLIAGRFRLVEPLGRGGMGRVYRARDELLGRPVAVKLIYDDAIVDSDLRHACALEARAAARLSHPGIVRILDSGFDDGHLYVVMSLAEGRTLAETLRAAGPLPPVRALEIAMQVAGALEAAHQEGIVHCDVKPSNLIVRPDGMVQLVDFGIAKIAASTTSLDSSTLQGSAEYVAPEQVEGASVDGRTDLYALGVVLYEMLAGRTPFGGGTIASVLARRLVNDPPSIRDAVPDLPIAVDRLVRRMLARAPADRFQTAGDLHAALAAARQATLAASLPPPPAASLTATMPFQQFRTGAVRRHFGRARAGAGRQRDRLRAAGERALALGAAAALAVIHAGRALDARLQPFMTKLLAGGAARVLGLVRRPSLKSGVGIAIVVGLLIGTAAARCSITGASAEAAAPPETVTVQAQATVSALPPTPQPTAPATQPPATQLPAAAAAPTDTPPPPTVVPTPEPTVVPEPTAAPAPPAQAIQPLVAPAAPPQERASDPKPVDKKPEGNGSAGRGAEKKDEKPRGNSGNGSGPQKKR